jgi:hypothetical protein
MVMNNQGVKIGFLNGNMLKIIAALSMLCDHIGYMLFPKVTILRIIGRIAFPIFAFMVAEGCRYTRNRLRHFLSIFILGVVMQVVMTLAGEGDVMNIFLTFSLSILLVYALDEIKKMIFVKKSRLYLILLSLIGFVFACILACECAEKLNMDYGTFGCLAPLFASLFFCRDGYPSILKKLDILPVHILTTYTVLIWHALDSGGVQIYVLLAIPLLLLYSGKRGKANLKYFFYAFYPAHMVIIYFIKMFLERN